MQIIETDLLVIGGGLAAVSAIEASKFDVRVTLVDKGRFARSGSTPTSGGSPHAQVPVELGGYPDDDMATFIRDNVVGGDYLADQEMTRILAEEGGQRVIDLERYGVPFVREHGRFKAIRTLGESNPRVGHVVGYGRTFMDALRNETCKRGVRVVEDTAVLHLMKHEGVVCGALAVNKRDGRPVLFKARLVILGSGGTTGLYGQSSANYLVFCDSYGLGLGAGARLKNMEFQEFTLVPAPFGRPIATMAIKGITAAGAKFYNDLGERFLERYAPELMELSVRSRLTVSVAREYRAGRRVLLDATFLDRAVSHLPKVERAGFDWRRERIPYVPAIHDSLGGIITDVDGRTHIPGLYAVGEAAGCQGAFGADRAGGAILACVVFAHRAGQATGRELSGLDSTMGPPIAELRKMAETLWQGMRDQAGRGDEDPGLLKTEIRQLADRYIGVIRTGDGLEAFTSAAPELVDRCARLSWQDTTGLIQAFEAQHLLLTGYAIARSALERKESRGHHFREDAPRKNDDHELRWIIISGRKLEDMSVHSVPVPFERYDIKPPRTGN